MPSNKAKMVKKLGSEEAYRAYMRELGSKPHKRGGKSKLVKQIEQKASKEGLSPEDFVDKVTKE